MRRLALSVAALLAASCDRSYDSPCRVTRADLVVVDPAIGPRTSVDLHRSRDRLQASWPKRELADAGAADPFPALTAFDLVELDERGGLLRHETIATPAELRARRGGLDAGGVVGEEGASFVYWVETTMSTDPDGRVRVAYATKLAYAGGPVIAPPRGACTRCRLRIALASLGAESIAVVRTEPDLPEATLGRPPAPPAFVALVIRRDGTVAPREVPWIAIPPPAALDAGVAAVETREPELSLEVDGAGRLVLVTDGRAWLVDPSLVPLAGPIALPAADARIAWSAPVDASLAWSVAPSQEGRESGTYARREIFAGTPDVRDRVSRGRAVLAVDRRGEEVGVTFESAGRTFFAALDPRGRKHGGDVLLVPAADPDRESEYGVYAPKDASMLVANGGGRFTSVTLGNGALSAIGVTCAP